MLRRQLPELAAVAVPFDQPYEIIVVDDGSQPPTLRLLEKLSKEFHALRLLRLDEPGGSQRRSFGGDSSGAGETIIATEAGRCYPAEQIASLIEWLPRADMIVGRRRRFGVPKLRERIARFRAGCYWAWNRTIRIACFGPHVARRSKTYRSQPEWLDICPRSLRQGYRIFETYVEYHGLSRRLQDVRPNPGDLLAAWWSCRRWRNQQAYELAPVAESQPCCGSLAPTTHRLLTGASTLHRIEPVANTRQAKSA